MSRGVLGDSEEEDTSPAARERPAERHDSPVSFSDGRVGARGTSNFLMRTDERVQREEDVRASFFRGLSEVHLASVRRDQPQIGRKRSSTGTSSPGLSPDDPRDSLFQSPESSDGASAESAAVLGGDGAAASPRPRPLKSGEREFVELMRRAEPGAVATPTPFSGPANPPIDLCAPVA